MKIILWKYKKGKKWYNNLVGKLICFFTKSQYVHAAIYFNGYRYESTVMNNQYGTLKTKVSCPSSSRYTLLELKIPLNITQLTDLKDVLNSEVVKARPYNFLKLVTLAFVYPTRKFWNWIGWVPFQHEFFGNVCSVFVDQVFKDIGIDLLPGNNEEYTVPGDFVKSGLLEIIDN